MSQPNSSQPNSPHPNPSRPSWSVFERFFAEVGIDETAYVKPVTMEGCLLFAAYAADGRLLDHHGSAELAIVTLLQRNLEPLRVH